MLSTDNDIAGTGTGKTFSFAIPLVERLQETAFNSKKAGRNPKVMVMAPTRELAKQIGDDFESISDGLSILCVYGGTPYYTQGKWLREKHLLTANNTASLREALILRIRIIIP
jgi:superfamily II DNA/RNA helicase